MDNNKENNFDEEKLYSKSSEEIEKLVIDVGEGLKTLFKASDSDEKKPDTSLEE